jgi:hypothetical protein
MPEHNEPLESTAAATECERRRAARHRCDLQPSWRILGKSSGESWGASVHDLSATGISLRVRCWIKPGTVLVVRLHGKGERFSRPLPMRVMHATARGEGEWLIGGIFVRALHEEEVRLLSE